MVRMWTPFIQLCAVGLLAKLSYQMARSPVLPRFAQDLGAAPELIGLIVAASTITGIFIKLPAGALSDVLGRRRMMLLGCLFFAAPPFLYPFAHSPGTLLALRFLHGFATAVFSPVASAFVADLSKEARGEKLGWFAAAGDIGSTLGPLIGGLLLFYTSSYPMTYLTVGVLGLCPLLLILRLPDDEMPRRAGRTLGERSQQFWSGIREVLGSRAVVIASLLEAAMHVGYGAFLGFFPTYAKGIRLNDAQIALVMGVQLAATMFAKPLSGRLSDRLGRKPMILAGLLLCAATLPAIPALASLWLLFPVSALFGLGVAIVTPSTTALVADLVKDQQMGSAMGVFGTIWDTGEASGPILAGLLIASMNYLSAFAVIASLMAAAAVIFAVLVRDPQAVQAGAGMEQQYP
ncbi:MAG: MFS transporter [candidate division NC10 bacterium]|nr:MFS transporter [candidate division NC10 bacterium]MDE2322235.1 MFS transporter [candidate division NC10 bacterium]